MTKSQKILFVGPFPPPYGGIANHTKLLFESELSNYFNLIKLNLSLPFENTEIVSEKKTINFNKLFIGLKKLMILLHKEKPKIIYIKMSGDCSCFREMFYIVVIRISYRARIVLHFHGMFKEHRRNFPFIIAKKNNWINKFIINVCFGLAHNIIFLSNHILNEFQLILNEKNRNKSIVIEHFADSKLFKPKHRRSDKINVLFVGRLSKDKGFFDVIKIIPDVLLEKRNVVFHFCGVPENEEANKKIKDELNALENSYHIRLHGLVYGEKKIKIYSEADVLLFPTHNEVFPNTILEGLAQGLPIITTKAGIIPTIIEEGKNGLFIKIGDSKDIKNKLLYLLNNPKLQKTMAINNRKKAEEKYDISIAVNKLKIIFNKEIAACKW